MIGASGKTGKLVVKQLVDKGYSVSALARRAETVKTYGQRVSVVVGDATNLEDLNQALAGQDAVISTIGSKPMQQTSLETAFIKNLLAAPASKQLKRFIWVSIWGVAASQDKIFGSMKLASKTAIKHIFADKNRAEALLASSQLPFVMVRPGFLSQAPAKGNVQASLTGENLRHTISRADLAEFMTQQLTSDHWLRQAPLVGYSR